MDKKIIRLKRNAVSAVLLQLVTIISGFVIPRLILKYYGSETNGTISSISQFIALISFMDMGVGAVVQSAMYKPLAQKDNKALSEIVASAEKYLRLIARSLLIYVIALLFVYPRIISTSISTVTVIMLIAALGANGFNQYYFGITDSLLLNADQRGYIVNVLRIGTIIANIVSSYILIVCGIGIAEVKFATSLIFLLRPVLLRIYVNKKYSIDRHIVYSKEPIAQKWNGIAQHISSVVLGQTDVVVLSVFSTLENVSIYAVYFLVVGALEQLIAAMMNGFTPILGEHYALKDIDKLERAFEWFEWLNYNVSTVLFGICSFLLVPFVMLYTGGISDANYYQPVFGILLLLAWWIYCVRIPHVSLILSAGHYKQTQWIFVIGAAMNICVSVAVVNTYGLVGVALGTFVSLAIQTILMIIYNQRRILTRTRGKYFRAVLTIVFQIAISIFVCNLIEIECKNYFCWFIKAVICSVVWTFSCALVNMIINKEKVLRLWGRIINGKSFNAN